MGRPVLEHCHLLLTACNCTAVLLVHRISMPCINCCVLVLVLVVLVSYWPHTCAAAIAAITHCKLINKHKVA